MHTTPQDSSSPEFNDFGSYRRKRRAHDGPQQGHSFRKIPHSEFNPPVSEDTTDGATGEVPFSNPAEERDSRRPPRKFGGKPPFGKKPFGKKGFGKKPFGKKNGFGFKPHRSEEPSFRDFAESVDEGPVPAPREEPEPFDRSFKHAGRFPHRGGAPWQPHGNKKPHGKFHAPGHELPADDESRPRFLRRPYGVRPEDGEEDFSVTERPPFGKKPFGKPFPGEKRFGKKPFGKKPFGKKPFYGKSRAKPPFGEWPDESASFAEDGSSQKKSVSKGKPFGKKPFGKKPYFKKPFGKKPYGHGKSFGPKRSFRKDRPSMPD